MGQPCYKFLFKEALKFCHCTLEKDEDKFQKCYFFMDTTDAMPLSCHFCVSVAQGAGVIL